MPSRFRLESLSSRLIAAAAVWTLLGLAVGAGVLSHSFRMAAQANFDAALVADMDSLVGAAELDPQHGVMLANVLNHNYERVYSGRYYQIKSGNAVILISHSLFDKTLTPYDTVQAGALRWGNARGPENQALRVLSRTVDLTPDNAKDASFTFTVAADKADVERQAHAFNTTLFWSFLLLGAGLIGAILVQVKIGLLPLRRVSTALANIRDGQARRLEGQFPAEIEPLAGELNALIQHSEEVVARARTHVSNLAHFLKTPLSVLAAEAQSQPGPLADSVQKQVDVMRRQVDHYLTRARAAGSLDVLGNRTQVVVVVDDLVRVLGRVHPRIDIDAQCDDALFFRGERQDLEEMLGNLLDNACKWAHARVQLRAQRAENRITLIIEDDGPGLTLSQRQQVGERGERLDERVPGSGLGLAIVRDIAKLYGGDFGLDASAMGGVMARLELPAIT